jgi:hypothetical protein
VATEPLPEVEHFQQWLAGEEAPARDGRMDGRKGGSISKEASTRQEETEAQRRHTKLLYGTVRVPASGQKGPDSRHAEQLTTTRDSCRGAGSSCPCPYTAGRCVCV